MYTGRIVFAQLMDLLPLHEFQKCVQRYQGNYRVKNFSCLDQFLTMAFAQLTYRESLRDIESCLRAMEPRLYHMGIRGNISRSTLADANETRDWRIYATFWCDKSHRYAAGEKVLNSGVLIRLITISFFNLVNFAKTSLSTSAI